MNQYQQASIDGWKKLLNPESLKANLIGSSLFLTAWEMLCDCITEQPRGFYCLSCDGEETEAYRDRVLARHKSPLQASLLWFKEQGVIDERDIDLVGRIRTHRNAIAHELPRFLSDANREIDMSLFTELRELVSKIDRWWIREIEIPTNPDFDDRDIDSIPDSEIHSGRMILLSVIVETAIGNHESAVRFYEDYLNAIAQKMSNAAVMNGQS